MTRSEAELLEEAHFQLRKRDAEIARLREALEPFANDASRWDDIPGVVRYYDDVELW